MTVETNCKLTKLRESDNPRHPNNIPEGEVIYGNYMADPVVYEKFWLNNYNGDLYKMFHTSIVQEIIDETTFRTQNSIYKIERL